MKYKLISKLALTIVLTVPPLLQAADYVIDTEKAHAFIQFRIKHLGYSWLLGRFNDFDGAVDRNRGVAARWSPAAANDWRYWWATFAHVMFRL